MQFITSGNRIAVENFTVGYLYTITFTGGEYIHCACTGIGMDFVMFSRTAPEYTFALTMETAEDVSSIDLYSEGGGTTNYNDLTNKPQINSIELVGNKSLNDLGIQPVITDDNKLSYTLISGLGTAATTASSDYATAAQGALADSAVQPADMNSALSTKQNLINSDNMLSADLVDDTSSTNKFATAAELQQIETNEANILIVEKNLSAKNRLNSKYADTQTGSPINGVTYTKQADGSYKATGTPSAASRLILTEANPAIGYLEITPYNGMVFSCLTATGSGTTFAADIIYYNDSNVYINEQHDYGSGVTIDIPDTVTKAVIRISIYTGAGQDINLTFKPMICDKPLWDAGYTDYKPYEPTNAELWAMIKAIQ